ncbi:DUF1707 domain-containing protein [Nocardiopsis sp. RSe5-2]|uniref:DUF1707 domain-containing protein n=1 Tax=Nocardiopsis endophytica TaxID=3018445 RepID=A0ABT4U887_9ACTN|nr:DUF1707 domain-containing protein [Nocardiopsis endophytica]MDA2813167.1 DUF1707 domain-containing protein [Nocardiopsis endophytica]
MTVHNGPSGDAMDSTSSAPRSGRPSLRVGDGERERTAAIVSDAAAAGYIAIDELDGRLDDVWAARTAGELDAVVADLPVDRLDAGSAARSPARPTARPTERPKRGEPSMKGFRVHLSAYIGVMTLLFGIWLMVGVTAGAWYPWFIWPALGWGIGVIADGSCTRARARRGGAEGLRRSARDDALQYARRIHTRHHAHGGSAYGAPWPPAAHRR